jgi:hypothetical protein
MPVLTLPTLVTHIPVTRARVCARERGKPILTSVLSGGEKPRRMPDVSTTSGGRGFNSCFRPPRRNHGSQGQSFFPTQSIFSGLEISTSLERFASQRVLVVKSICSEADGRRGRATTRSLRSLALICAMPFATYGSKPGRCIYFPGRALQW